MVLGDVSGIWNLECLARLALVLCLSLQSDGLPILGGELAWFYYSLKYISTLNLARALDGRLQVRLQVDPTQLHGEAGEERWLAGEPWHDLASSQLK